MIAFLALLVLKLWLASSAIAAVWCVSVWCHINSPVLPAASVLILCGAIRVLA
jgi:hypothetical protein